MKKLRTLMYSAGLLLLGACSNQEGFEKPNENNVLSFNSNIISASTRVIDNNWELGDAIGVYALNSADQTLFGGFSNIKYNSSNAGATGKFTPDVSNAGVSLDGVTAVDIKAYYPFKEGVVDFVYPIDVTTTTPLVDLLYANNISNITDNGNPDLIFRHQLSKFELILSIDGTQGNLVTSLAGLTVNAIDGTKAKGEFNLSSGILSFVDNAQVESITPIFNVSSGGNSALVTAYLIPGQSTNTIEVPMVLDGKTFIWKATLGLDLQLGKQYTFKAALREIEPGKVILVNPDASIQDWEVGHEDGDPGQVDPSEDEKSLTVAEREFEVKAEGGSKTFDVSASQGLVWTVNMSGDASWITATKNVNTVSVAVLPNETPEVRTVNVVLSADGVADVVIAVTQEGKKETPTEPEAVSLFSESISGLAAGSSGIFDFMEKYNELLNPSNVDLAYQVTGDVKFRTTKTLDGHIAFIGAGEHSIEISNIGLQNSTRLNVSFNAGIINQFGKADSPSVSISVNDVVVRQLSSDEVKGLGQKLDSKIDIEYPDLQGAEYISLKIQADLGTNASRGLLIDNIVVKGYR